MTFRSVFLGFLGAALICGLSYINDQILQQTYLVGNNMPVAVYGALIVMVAVVNPLLKRRGFRGTELAVILALTLAACCIPGSGLLRTFTTSLMLPHHYNRLEPGWRETHVLETCPPKMLADISGNEDVALNGFLQGLGEPNRHISFADIPWSAWTRTLLFWIPVILSLWFALTALSLVVHRQWSDHEHLPYPVAEFAQALMPEEGGGLAGVFRNRLFWIATGLVLFVHMNNFACQWFPEYLIQIPVRFNLMPLARLVPALAHGGGTRLLAPTMYFSVIGLSYFLASDVAFSCGIGPFLWALVTGICATYGLSLVGAVEGAGYPALRLRAFLNFGANFGMFLAIIFLGRRYYLTVLKRAFGLRTGDRAEPGAVWGMRVFLAMTFCFVMQLVLAGLEPFLAVIYTVIIITFFVMISRVMAETGMFYVQPYYFPCGVIWGVFGAAALGMNQLMILLTMSMILVVDPRESIMPFISNSLKVLDMNHARLGRVTVLCGVAVILGLLIALPVTLYFQYDRGVSWSDTWGAGSVPRMQFENVSLVQKKLEIQGKLAESAEVSGIRRLALMQPDGSLVFSMVLGFLLVLGFSAARIRFTWWPLHPILFLTWATEPQWRLCGAFLVGWLIKVIITKYGGARVYQRLKPLMIGLIAGEVLGAVIPSIIGAVYFVVSGDLPPRFWVLPG